MVINSQFPPSLLTVSIICARQMERFFVAQYSQSHILQRKRATSSGVSSSPSTTASPLKFSHENDIQFSPENSGVASLTFSAFFFLKQNEETPATRPRS